MEEDLTITEANRSFEAGLWAVAMVGSLLGGCGAGLIWSAQGFVHTGCLYRW